MPLVPDAIEVLLFGATIDEWRARRAAERAAQHGAELGAGWQRSPRRLLLSALLCRAARALPGPERQRNSRRSMRRGLTA
jgi:hypothetical protein